MERRGQTVIAWGLGNLAFACDCTRESEGIVLELELVSGEARVRPIHAGLLGAPAAPSPDPAGVYDLLTAIGSPCLDRRGATAVLCERASGP